MTTEINCSSRPFYLTVKFTKVTLVDTSALYFGFDNFVVIYNLNPGLYLTSFSPKYIKVLPATVLNEGLRTGSNDASNSSPIFSRITTYPFEIANSMIFIIFSFDGSISIRLFLLIDLSIVFIHELA